jgi:hypothetical protein
MNVRLLYLLRVVQVAPSATGWSPFQRSPTGCVCVHVCLCLIVCDLETSTMRRPRPDLVYCATWKNKYGRCPLSTRQSSRHIEQTTDWTTEESWFAYRQRQGIFSSWKCPNFPWPPTKILFNIFCSLIPRRTSDSWVKMTTNFHLLRKLRMRWAMISNLQIWFTSCARTLFNFTFIQSLSRPTFCSNWCICHLN